MSVDPTGFGLPPVPAPSIVTGAGPGVLGRVQLPDGTWTADQYDNSDDAPEGYTVYREKMPDGTVTTHRVKTRDWRAYEKAHQF